ncbi:MAG: cyclic 2,3-diphosphoglycerate synthase [Xanthobacteraceae bacterium]
MQHPPNGPAVRRRRVVIMGAAGRDFHNFNVVYRDDPTIEVVAITAAQIPGIGGRIYPPVLAGSLYPRGIPIVEETQLEALCRAKAVDQVVFAYSDVSHQHVMHAASRALAVAADFILLGPKRTFLHSSVPVIAVCATRTGCGKSSIARWVTRRLRDRGKRIIVIRHPMPYGNLAKERVQRFASRADLDAAQCTAEEREEYEPHIAAGDVVLAGVDYAEILQAAELEADIIVWDGGNNDFSFIKPDLQIAVADALRPRQIATHHPGETVARMADVLVVNKVDAASAGDVEIALAELRAVNPAAPIVLAASPIRLDDAPAVRGRRVLVIEDGPTITHGGMAYGAGYVAALAAGAAEIVDPRPSAAADFAKAFEKYPHIGRVLPALGYGAAQLQALAQTINSADADVVVSATPVDLARLLDINKPIVRASYEFAETGEPTLSAIVDGFVEKKPMPAELSPAAADRG